MYDSITFFFCSLIIADDYDKDDDHDYVDDDDNDDTDNDVDDDDNNEYREGTSTKEVDVVVRKVETSGTDEE